MILVTKEVAIRNCAGYWFVTDDHGIADGSQASYLWKNSTWNNSTGATDAPIAQAPGWFPTKEEALAALDKAGCKPDRIIE